MSATSNSTVVPSSLVPFDDDDRVVVGSVELGVDARVLADVEEAEVGVGVVVEVAEFGVDVGAELMLMKKMLGRQ